MTAALAALWRHPTGRIGLVLVVFVVLFSLGGAWLIPWEPNRIAVLSRFQPPGWEHPMGTDHLGRDLAARLAYGGRVALGVAGVTLLLALGVGTGLGVAAAFAPGWLGRTVLGVFDLVGAFPGVVLALAVVALLGPGLDRVVGIVAVTLMPQFGRVARAQALALREGPMLEAARAVGVPAGRALRVYVLPQLAGPLLVLAGMSVPAVITVEAGLSFLGVGVPPPQASWGTLLNDGYVNLGRSVWGVVFPAGMLAVATLGFTLLGEAVRDVGDH